MRATDITLDWLNQVLTDSCETAGPEATSLLVEPVPNERAAVWRLRVVFERRPLTRPVYFILKVPPPPGLLTGYAPGAREVFFYQFLAPLLPLASPRCLLARIDLEKGESFLLLDDVREAIPGSQRTGLSAHQARAAIRGLAAAHAMHWGRVDRPPLPTLRKMVIRTAAATPEEIEARFEETWPRVSASLYFGLSRPVRLFGDRLVGNIGRTLQPLFAAPETLVHGDYRAENLLFRGRARATTVIAFDWEQLTLGSGLIDLASLLVGGLGPRVRFREHELIQLYHNVLRSGGVIDFAWNECVQLYRLGVVRGLIHAVLACVDTEGAIHPSNDNRMLISRYNETCERHQIWELRTTG